MNDSVDKWFFRSIMAIIILSIIYFLLTMIPVRAMALDFGECVTLNDTHYCAPNATIAPNFTCAFENCTGYINQGINDTLKVCSETKNLTQSILSSVNGSFAECHQMSINLSNSYVTIQDLTSLVNASANCTGRLNVSEDSLAVCLNDKVNAQGDANSEKARADSAWSQFIQANIFTFAIGGGVVWFFLVRKKIHSATGGEELLEPEEDM